MHKFLLRTFIDSNALIQYIDLIHLQNVSIIIVNAIKTWSSVQDSFRAIKAKDSPETLLKLCFSSKFPRKEIR